MKVYLVENSYGSYDDLSINIDKVFDSKQKAEEYVTKVKVRIAELEILISKSLDDEFDKNNTIYEKAVEQFNIDFPNTYYDAWDSNHFSIKEIGVE